MPEYTPRDWANWAQQAASNPALLRARDELKAEAMQAAAFDMDESPEGEERRRSARYTLHVLGLMEDRLRAYIAAADNGP